MMSKNRFYALLGLTFIWIILMEANSWISILSGVLISLICLWFARKFMPLGRIKDVRFPRLLLFLLYLLKEIYVQGFFALKLIFTGGKTDIVEMKTELKSDFLKAMLMGSIALTPCSTPLDLNGDTLTVLLLHQVDGWDSEQAVEALRTRLEKPLLKAQK
ncbi:MAG: Na+/H+ antiporter subunit E [Oscillospiraceae bacterium]|nr:Na+/H+ antiporter subunit E [Oscillospiraceae bacterium]